jgi:hypothetical protein
MSNLLLLGLNSFFTSASSMINILLFLISQC